MSSDHLRQYVERIERISCEIAELQADRRDIFAEAKAVGFDAATLRKVIARRAMAPDDRRAADAVLESYEAALGMADEDGEPIMRPGAMELATALLAAEITGMDDSAHAAQLVDHVLSLLDLRAEITLMRQQESERKKLAKVEGFDAKQLAVTVRWFEKCAKYGQEAMRTGEEVFHLYRATVNERPAGVDSATDDEKLRALFAAPEPKAPPKRVKALNAHRAAAQAARRAISGEM